MRLFLAILVGKLILFITQTLKIGGGSAAPGLYALKIDPNLVKKLASKIPTQVVITGTNGKTTTSRLLAHFVKNSGQNLKVLRNSTGSNLARGVASALISNYQLLTTNYQPDIAIWELDEAAFNTVVFETKPQVIVFLNAFRDQLDRYGEVDTVVKKWQRSLDKIDWNPTVLINGSDPNVAHLVNHKNIQGQLFTVKGVSLLWERSSHPKSTQAPTFEAQILKNKELEGTDFKLFLNHKSYILNLPLPGVYHIFDFLAAFACAYQLNLPVEPILDSLKNFSPAFGRVEKITLQPSRLQAKLEILIFLIKNPAGASSVFETIAPSLTTDDSLLIALNDNFADGTDVSWIWDSKFEQLVTSYKSLVTICSGTRAYDLALRLKYAGFDKDDLIVEPDLEKALELAKDKAKKRVFILPTYTALLEFQRILAKQGIKKHYWRDR